MSRIDYTKYVVREVAQTTPIRQTDLTVRVFGSSGKGSKVLTDVLFPATVRKGLISLETKGRSKIFSITPAGLDYLKTQEF